MNTHFSKVLEYDPLMESIVAINSVDTSKVEQLYGALHEEQINGLMQITNVTHDAFGEVNSLLKKDFTSKKKSHIEKALGKYHRNLKKNFRYFANYSTVGESTKKINDRFLAKTKKNFLSETDASLADYEGPIMTAYNETFGNPKVCKYILNGGLLRSFESIQKIAKHFEDAQPLDSSAKYKAEFEALFADTHKSLTKLDSLDMRFVDSIKLKDINRPNTLSFFEKSHTMHAKVEKVVEEFYKYLDRTFEEGKKTTNGREFNRIIKENREVALSLYYYCMILRALNFMFMWTTAVHIYAIVGDSTIQLPRYTYI